MATAISKRRALLDPPTRARVAGTKWMVALGCVGTFGVAFVLTKVSHPSHAKHPLTQLQAPGGFINQLHDDQLRGGVIAPPQAPAEAQTAAS
jgi:hypothetical protein